MPPGPSRSIRSPRPGKAVDWPLAAEAPCATPVPRLPVRAATRRDRPARCGHPGGRGGPAASSPTACRCASTPSPTAWRATACAASSRTRAASSGSAPTRGCRASTGASSATTTRTDGLAGPSVRAVLEQDDGTYWVGTNAGLFRFDPRPRPGRPLFERVPLPTDPPRAGARRATARPFDRGPGDRSPPRPRGPPVGRLDARRRVSRARCVRRVARDAGRVRRRARRAARGRRARLRRRRERRGLDRHALVGRVPRDPAGRRRGRRRAPVSPSAGSRTTRWAATCARCSATAPAASGPPRSAA